MAKQPEELAEALEAADAAWRNFLRDWRNINVITEGYRRRYIARYEVRKDGESGWFVFDRLRGRVPVQKSDKADCIDYAQRVSGFEPADGNEQTYERQILAALEHERQRNEKSKRLRMELSAAEMAVWRAKQAVKAAARRAATKVLSEGSRPSEGMSREDLIDALIRMAEDPRAIRQLSPDDLRRRYDQRADHEQ
jgi:hypothetical protein